MFSQVYWVEPTHPCVRLGTMARPRGNDWLEDEVKALKRAGVDTLVSALTLAESYQLGLRLEESYCALHGIEFINYPIQDRDLPDSIKTWQKLTQQLADELLQGRTVVTHCRIGIGRASMIALSTLVQVGINFDSAFNMLEQARGLSIPDTEQQLQWLRHVASLSPGS